MAFHLPVSFLIWMFLLYLFSMALSGSNQESVICCCAMENSTRIRKQWKRRKNSEFLDTKGTIEIRPARNVL